jgi:hypothetical protein
MCQARAVECNELKEPSTMEITTVGLDIAKRVFQLHGVDAAGKAVLRRKLQRDRRQLEEAHRGDTQLSRG